MADQKSKSTSGPDGGTKTTRNSPDGGSKGTNSADSGSKASNTLDERVKPDKFGQGKSVILTFDDGPYDSSRNDGALKSILQTLSKHHATAEFYMQGNKVQEDPCLTQSVL